MSPLIEVAPETLAGVGERLTAAIGVVDQIKGERDSLKALVEDCGDDGLHDAACTFLDKWAYGVGCLEQDARTLASMLTQAGRVYLDTDTAIGGSFDDGR
jgi:hypothetical protein